MSEKLSADLNIIQSAPIELELLDGDLNIIQKLDDEPNDVGGLTSAELKAKFDESGNIIKKYINETLIPAVLAEDATEESRKQAEAARVAAEQTRQTNEETRKSNETARVTAEGNRATAEGARANAETARVQNETERKTSEASRASAETARANAEAQRQTNEQLRQMAENSRGFAETQRVDAEDTRKANETERVQAETSRDNAEAQRQTNEQLRQMAENSRGFAETQRVNAEDTRKANETARVQAETSRDNAETQRQSNEVARQNAESQRVSAENARNVWEDYDVTKVYTVGNKVVYGGSSYLCIKPCISVNPMNDTYWRRIAGRGANGAPGPQGPQGEKGEGGKSAFQSALDGGYTGTETQFNSDLANVGDLSAVVQEIEGKIPSAASSTNKLVSASEMGDAIEAVEANQLYATNAQGSFATKAALTGATTFYNADGTVATPTKNDVAYVLADESHDGKSAKYVIANKPTETVPPVWGFVITFSNTTFAQAQMDAINSGVTSAKRAGYDSHVVNRSNPHNVTKEQVGLGNVRNIAVYFNDKFNVPDEITLEYIVDHTTGVRYDVPQGTYSKPSEGIPKTDLASAVQTSLSKADTALQQHQSLAAYRTAEAQDTIDVAKETKGKITIGGVEKTANTHTVTIVTNGVTTNLTLVGVS